MESSIKTPRMPGWLRVVLVGRSPKRTLLRIAVLVGVVLLVRGFVLLPVRIQGPSMMPTYQPNGVNFVNRLAYLRSEPQRGDVVGIRLAGPSIIYMKRIVGLPGETVCFHRGKFVVNGKPLDEPYVKWAYDWERPPITLGPDNYYCVGDNRSMPEQDHEEGVTTRARIVGKILLCKNLFGSSSVSR